MLTQSRVQADVQRILNLYRRSGRFGATVDPKIIKLDQNRVNLVFEIKEGEPHRSPQDQLRRQQVVLRQRAARRRS